MSDTATSMGPKVEPAPNGRFFMAIEEWQAVQCYVEAGIRLPITKDEAIVKLGVSSEDADHFNDLWQAYANVHDHCQDFQARVFPNTVSLASDIVDYGRTKAPVFYKAILKLLTDLEDPNVTPERAAILRRNLALALDNLTKDAQSRADKATAAMNQINGFIQQTQQDKGFLEPIQDRYHKEYEGEQGKIAQYTQEIEDDKNLIASANEEYQKDVTIACTTATYAWVFPAGTIAAAVVAGVYGKRAQDALDNIHRFQDMMASSEVRLRAAVMLKQDLELANTSLDGLVTKLNAALPVLAKAKGIWNALADDLKQVVNTIKNDIADMPSFIAELGVDEALGQWKTLADEADGYRVNAFITVKSVAEIANDPQHQAPIAA